jgi:nucleoside-diphosphate-sugar epimerase
MGGRAVLVTGATGLVGSCVLEQLACLPDVEAVGTSRRGGIASSGIAAWDMSSGPPPEELRRRWHAIVHTSANTRWTMSPAEARSSNVDTVAGLAPLVGPDTHVVHVSTAYALGLDGSPESPERSHYRNTYEWSKAHAERLAAELFPRLTIVRPPLTIGTRTEGRAARFSGMYLILRGMVSGTVPAVVGAEDAYFDVVPVDDLARLLVQVSQGEPLGRALTIAGGEHAPRLGPALRLIVDALNGWRAERGLEELPRPPLLSPERWNRFFLPFARDHLGARQLRILELLGNFEPYLAIDEPLRPTHPVEGVEGCIAASVRYWAEANARIASLVPRPWAAAAR